MNPLAWSRFERWPNAGEAERVIPLVADEATRVAVARQLGVPAVHRLEGSVRLRPWLDGAELFGKWSATVLYTCGVSLDPFEQPLEGGFTLRLVPVGSRNAPGEEAEMNLDPDADDAPDVVEGLIDVAAYVVEHVALEIDPFPRKPGVVFEAPDEPPEPSPFAALARLKPDGSA